MITLWGIVLSIPELALGGLLLHAPQKTKEILTSLSTNRILAAVLTCVAWFWTAHELDIIGIDVFDMICKRYLYQPWIMAGVLSYLCWIWMPKNLVTRAFTGILMLYPASLFRVTRLLVPASGFAMVHILVGFAYISAIIGMYGMFYPWRLEKALGFFVEKAPRTLGALLILVGLALATAGIMA